MRLWIPSPPLPFVFLLFPFGCWCTGIALEALSASTAILLHRPNMRSGACSQLWHDTWDDHGRLVIGAVKMASRRDADSQMGLGLLLQCTK
ncbi:hypothetical protein B0T10DRAFT_475100 [Thelonectria olida]|uniref:Uncharacterized protein n=1 Tax=Thelonectria olida TaxID=1576542 RepID=A0A9P8WFZ1_9HYPO|nr:hypothetical protein B0T10DRAFT_475100 [Thelonectria olida]